MLGSRVTIENISKRFGTFTALDSVSLEIKQGEFFSLLGPSGCGKTTLLRIIAGFEDPSEGCVYLDNTNVIPVPANKRHVNTVFQNYALFPHLSVFENVAFPLRLRKKSKHEIEEKVGYYLDLVKLPTETGKFPGQLSGGQKQRVAIARALINEPSVLLLDEPLSALDAKLRQHMLIELDSIHDKIGITFIYVTHDQQEALSVSDRVAVMNEGKVLQVGAPAEIYERPSDIFVARFIGENNFMHGTITGTQGPYATAEVAGLGTVTIPGNKTISQGDRVRITIRPEKIRIASATKKPHLIEGINCLEGVVDEIIYSGFQSKFFVRLADQFMFRVFRQHVEFAENEEPVRWNDSVVIWWQARDMYVVEVQQDTIHCENVSSENMRP